MTEKYCQFLAREGIALAPHSEAALDRFAGLEEGVRTKKVRAFSSYLEACESSLEKGSNLRSSKTFLEGLLRENGLRSCDDLFDRIAEGDVVEVYSSDFTQLFRNLRFLEICSYSIADLYSFEWTELYRRPQAITDAIVSSIRGIMDATTPRTIQCEVPPHFLEEVFSPRRHQFRVEQGIFSPLWDGNGNRVAFVGTLRAEVTASLNGSGPSKSTVRVLP